MVRAEPHEPLLTLEVGVDVRLSDVVGLLLQDRGQLGALQQRQLRRGVAGRHGADAARLDDRDPSAGAGEQQGCREAGQAGADHEVVEPLVGRERVARGQVGSIEPQ